MMFKFFCRVFQFFFGIIANFLPWRRAIPVEGCGAIEKLPQILEKLKIKKPLLVSGGTSVKIISVKILAILKNAGIPCSVFAEVEANPCVNTVNKIYKMYVEDKCSGFIALGGGSPVDAAKGAACLAARPGKNIKQLGGLLKIRKKLPPFIAVPTTAGTGSETTIAAMISDPEKKIKYAIMDLNLIPDYAVLDPELTRSLPPDISASTGMDALCHAVESWLCCFNSTRESRSFALDAVRLIFLNIKKVYEDGSNLEARNAMLLASYKAGFAFTRTGVGNVHAISHALSGVYNTAHGLANAVILPLVLEDYGKKVHKKLAQLAEVTGLAQEGSSAKYSEKAELFIKEIYSMNKKFGFPGNFGFIKNEDIPLMSEHAFKEANPLYPVPVIYSRKNFARLIEKIKGLN